MCGASEQPVGAAGAEQGAHTQAQGALASQHRAMSMSSDDKGVPFVQRRVSIMTTGVAGVANSFGAKKIGLFASVALLINNITGPGVPQLPNLFAEAGWLTPVLCVIVVWVMTTLSSAMYCEAMRHMPNNEEFQGRAEYSTIVDYYFGRRWYVAAQIGLNGALQSLNIISVIQSAQVMDNLISAIFGKSYALNLSPFPNYWQGVTINGSTEVFSAFDTNDLDEGNAWGCHVVVTLGYVVTLCMAVPCGMWNLDDNMGIQQAAFVLTLACWVVWIVVSLSSLPTGSLSAIPAVNSDADTGSQAGVLGTILFNFGFVTTVPSWVNEKAPEVSVNKALWVATASCVAVFFSVGLTGAAAFSDVLQGTVTGTCARQSDKDSPHYDPDFNCANDLLQLFSAPPVGTVGPSWTSAGASALLKVSVYAFPIVAVVSSIPVFSIVIKYNLVENGFSKRVGFLWGVLFPWLAALPLLYMPQILSQFINFSSLLFVSFTDFIVPFSLYVVLQRKLKAQAESARVTPLNVAPPPDGRSSGNGAHAALLDGTTTSNTPSLSSEAAIDLLAERALESLRHTTFPRRWRLSYATKQGCAITMGVVLVVLSCLATVLTIQQGTYEFNGQVCALVGA